MRPRKRERQKGLNRRAIARQAGRYSISAAVRETAARERARARRSLLSHRPPLAVVAIKENHQLPEPIIEAMAKEEEVKHAIAKKEAAIARQL